MSPPTRTGTGCLVLFGLPFFGIGLFMAGLILWNVADAVRMRSWQPVPATLTSLNLEHHTSSKGRGTDVVRATYTYCWNDQVYANQRVAITDTADNFGYWPELYHRLQGDRQRAQVYCWVNPADPSLAVLDRDLRWGDVAFNGLFVITFGGIGGFLVIGSLVDAWRRRHRERLRAVDPASTWRADPRWQGPTIAAAQGGLVAHVGLTLLSGIAYLVIVQGYPSVPGIVRPYLLLVLALPLAVLAKSAIHLVHRRLHEGRWHLTPGMMPLIQGTRNHVVVTARRPPVKATALGWTVTCTERITLGTGKSTSTITTERWSHRGSVDLRQEGPGTPWQVGLDLPLPADLPPADPDTGIVWDLTLRPVGGRGSTTFPLPVVPAKGPGPHLVQADLTPATELQAADAVASAGLKLESTRQGLCLRKASGHGSVLHVGFFWGTVGVASLLGLLLALRLHIGGWEVPTYLIAALVGIATLISLSFLRNLAETRIVEVDRQGVSVMTWLFFPGQPQRWSAETIQDLELRSRQSINGVDQYQIVLRTTDGRITALTPHLGPSPPANAVLTVLRRALGRA